MARAKLLGALGPSLTLAGALALATLLPVQADQRFLPSLNLGLPVFAIVAVATVLAVFWIETGWRLTPRLLESAALQAGCALAIALAAGSVAATAETVDLGNVVLAQRYTGLYLLKQPVAAWIFVVAVALGARRVPLLLVLSGLGATLFLGGYLGGRLEGVSALVLKTAAMVAFVLLLRASMRRVTAGPRLAIGWAAAGAGLLNLIVTLIQLGP